MGNLIAAKKDIQNAIHISGTQGDWAIPEGFTHPKSTVVETNLTSQIDGTNDIAGFIHDGWQDFWKGSGAGLIALCRDCLAKSLMRAFRVVEFEPNVKLGL